MNTTLYGISNCDTVKKARKWLEAHGVDYSFHDFRKDGLDPATLSEWTAQLGWEALLNRRSTSWRQLADADKTDLDSSKALELMLRQPTLIKRPVLEGSNQLLVGFSEQAYKGLLNGDASS